MPADQTGPSLDCFGNHLARSRGAWVVCVSVSRRHHQCRIVVVIVLVCLPLRGSPTSHRIALDSTRTHPLGGAINTLPIMSGANSIKVVARFRPQNKLELSSGGKPVVEFLGDYSCAIDVCLSLSPSPLHKMWCFVAHWLLTVYSLFMGALVDRGQGRQELHLRQGV